MENAELYFFDTSALIKLFIDEVGSHALREFFLTKLVRIIVSSITQVEAHSAIYRLVREAYLSPAKAQEILRSIDAELESTTMQPVDGDVLQTATALLHRSSLRTLDALQISSALTFRVRLGTNRLYFVTSDSNLLRAARAEGFSVWDPSISPLPPSTP